MPPDAISIQFCSSWSYKGTFNQVAQIIKEHSDSQLSIHGFDYPPSATSLQISKIIVSIQAILLIVLFAGEYIFANLLQLPRPAILIQFQVIENLKIWYFYFFFYFFPLFKGVIFSYSTLDVDKVWYARSLRRFQLFWNF